MLNRCIKHVLQRRWWYFAVLLCLYLLLIPSIQKALVPNNSLAIWFLDDDPNLINYHHFQNTFANDEVVLLKLEFADSLFNNENLNYLQGLVTQLQALDGVFQIHSLLSVQDSLENEDGLSFEKLIATNKLSSEQWQQVIHNIQTNPLIKKRFVSVDGKQVMLWIEPIVSDTFDQQRTQIVHSIDQTATQYLGDKTFALAGLSVIYTALNDITQKDVSIFFSASFTMMLVLMVLIFRRWQIVVAIMGIIIFSSGLSLGFYGLLGHQINMLTVMLPTLIAILGIADAVHFPVVYQQLQQVYPHYTRVKLTHKTLVTIIIPCFLTTLTTVLGFLSLAHAPMEIIQEYGIYTALGIALAFFISLLFMAIALLSLCNLSLPKFNFIQYIAKQCFTLLKQHSQLTSVIFGTLILLGLLAASQIRVDTYTLGYLPDDSRVVQDHETILNTWGAYGTVEFMVEAAPNYQLDSPEILNALTQFREQVTRLPELKRGFSLDNIYQRMVEVFTGDPSADKSMNTALVEQLNLVIEGEQVIWDKSDPAYQDNFLSLFRTEDNRTARVTFVADIVSAAEIKAIMARIDTLALNTFGNYAHYTLTGYTPLYVKIVDYVMQSQIQSFLYVISFLFIVMWLWTRSWKLAGIALLANMFPVLMMFAVMGLFNITLDIGTAVVAAIVIGISIDDTIHFLFHWQQGLKQRLSWLDNIRHSYAYAGKAIILTTLLLILSFPLMMLSDLKTVFYFGLLTTVAAVSALLADLLLLPLLLRKYQPKNLSETSPLKLTR